MNAPIAWAIWGHELFRKKAEKKEFQSLIDEFRSHYPNDEKKFEILMVVLNKYANDYERNDLFS